MTDERALTGPMTHRDLVEATGFKRPSDQLRALLAIGMRPVIGPGGVPRITWEAYNLALAGGPPRPAEEPRAKLNWGAVERAR